MSDRYRILAVEDDPEIAHLYRSVLAEEGYDVLVACDAREALRLLAAHPDVVLLDLMLPDTDGYSVLRRIRERPDLKGVPVIVVSASLPPGRLRIDGAQAVVRKPFEFQRLIRAIEGVRHQAHVAR